MSADIKQIKNRIKSVDSTLHITKAMKLMASSKIHRAEAAFRACRPYTLHIEEITGELLTKENGRHPAVAPKNPDAPELCIIIAADRGLAGSFNGALFRMLDASERRDGPVIAIGKRAVEYAARAKRDTVLKVASSEKITSDQIERITEIAVSGYLRGDFSRVSIAYNRFRNALTQYPDEIKLLPLEISPGTGSITEYEPGLGEALSFALPFCVRARVRSAVKESYLSEQYARRNAMDSATENAQEMIDSLTLKYNRARQNSITQEITEIVAGANAETR